MGKTPFYTKLRCNKDYFAEIAFDSAHVEQRMIYRQVKPLYMVVDVMLLLTLYGAPSILVDMLTGSYFELNNHYIIAKKQQ